MKRTIIEINEDKCVGCGLCAGACEQGAIQMVDGKAKLMSSTYCDGLGMCLPACPVDAIKLTEKEADEFDEDRKGFALNEGEASKGCGSTKERVLKPANNTPKVNPFTSPAGNPFETVADNSGNADCGCGGAHDDYFKPETTFKPNAPITVTTNTDGIAPSQLRQWPVQINLVNAQSSFFDDCNLLIAADCTAYAYANFHNEFIKGRVTLIGCPKLDNLEGYLNKLTEIFKSHDINSVTVARMSVPCCGGLGKTVEQAIANAGKAIPYLIRTLTPEGEII